MDCLTTLIFHVSKSQFTGWTGLETKWYANHLSIFQIRFHKNRSLCCLAGWLGFLDNRSCKSPQKQKKMGGCSLTCLFPFLAFPLGNPRFPLVQFSLQYFLGIAVWVFETTQIKLNNIYCFFLSFPSFCSNKGSLPPKK